ncbi:PREDICTED: mediator-associated protein 2 [Camelina sativa]|uniref:Mediator-associated protein 2 n=1 Tax=Camelina sativa TaxID=90675 RepID=A0ABM0UQ53_CAMSA|nr:PREDICTED: mediator-associated protein 2 [Camelina sativa]XP_010444411.1 PREDICTED: mediator-associated protein 2 [Camelina sativa]XP_010444412.1 PREDICTED: mediator-associated protein 2 [Camelina sativa]
MGLDYEPNEDFVVATTEEVDDAEISPEEEIWILQYPLGRGPAATQFPEVDEDFLEFDNDLDKEGIFGNFVDSSGTKVDLASYPPQDTESTMILPSENSTIAGRISRRVALVRYAEPNELLQKIKARSQQKLVGAVTNSSGKYSNPTQSSRLKSSKHSASSRSSKQKSLFSSFTEAPKSPKRKHSSSSSGKHGISTSTSSERLEKSKKKKIMKMEE